MVCWAYQCWWKLLKYYIVWLNCSLFLKVVPLIIVRLCQVVIIHSVSRLPWLFVADEFSVLVATTTTMLGQLLRIVYLTQTQPENKHAKLLIPSVPVIGSSVLETAHKHRTVELKYMIIYMYCILCICTYIYIYIYMIIHISIYIYTYGYIIIYIYITYVYYICILCIPRFCELWGFCEFHLLQDRTCAWWGVARTTKKELYAVF